jgi:hypothetical protein
VCQSPVCCGASTRASIEGCLNKVTLRSLATEFLLNPSPKVLMDFGEGCKNPLRSTLADS